MANTKIDTKNLDALNDEDLMYAWDEATERAERYGWGRKTTAEVERIEAEVIKRGLAS